MRTVALLTPAVVALAAAQSTSAFAWGQEGHSIVGEIAQRELTPAALAAVSQILGSGASLASVGSWADDYRAANHPESFRWHFVDIPATADAKYDRTRDCKDVPGMGDCVVAEIDRLKKVLADPAMPAKDKVEPLMFMVHFVGDMSQPLHCAERTVNGMPDAGGNTFFVTFNGHKEHINTAVTFHSDRKST